MSSARDAVWARLGEAWDVVVIGGGITGAGILREAARRGLRALLLERRDFAWGTSSRSSKLVHGGLRYLKEGKLGLTRESILERERLLAEGDGLVDPLGFLFAHFEGERPGRLLLGLGLTIYDFFSRGDPHRRLDPSAFHALAPHLSGTDLDGGFWYRDAETDDARLVLRVLFEAVGAGAAALNYAGVEGLLAEKGRVIGVRVRDAVDGREAEVRARAVLNATGVWVDGLRKEIGAPPRMRPLRGSHLVFPAWRLPAAQAVTLLHPRDNRPLFVFPWEGATVAGTTDVDHRHPLEDEPAIQRDEVDYLMEALTKRFPSLGLSPADAVATYSGVRPVIGTGKADPSKESRDHVVWDESGLVTVTGGKLTTFRKIALDALRAVRHRLPEFEVPTDRDRVLDPVAAAWPAAAAALDPAVLRRLLGRYGASAVSVLAGAAPEELEPVPGTRLLWAELRHAVREESVVHLEDLLLRRVRLGLLTPEGGRSLLPRVRAICQPALSWDDARWETEERSYLDLCRTHYGLPA